MRREIKQTDNNDMYYVFVSNSEDFNTLDFPGKISLMVVNANSPEQAVERAEDDGLDFDKYESLEFIAVRMGDISTFVAYTDDE